MLRLMFLLLVLVLDQRLKLVLNCIRLLLGLLVRGILGIRNVGW